MTTARDVLITCVGLNFGPNPETRIDEIRESRYRTGKNVVRQLKISATDVVADIGSGCGFVTRAAAEIAIETHCIDVSKEFLDYTRYELSDIKNVHFHHVDYAKFPIADESLDKIFSTAVFIHFYYYDFLFNLIEVNRVLKPGGSFYVEIVDADVLDLDNVKAIKSHMIDYRNTLRSSKQGGARPRFIQPFSLTAFRHLSQQLGFEMVWVEHVSNVAQIVVRKVRGPQLPEWLAAVV